MDDRRLDKEVVISDVLSQEDIARQAGEESNTRLNFPNETPKPVSTLPEGFGLEEGFGKGGTVSDKFWSEPRRVDEENLGYEEDVVGEFPAVPDEAALMAIEQEWKKRFPGEEIPVDLNDPKTGLVEYELLLNEIRRKTLRSISESISFESKPLELATVETMVEAGIDVREIKNRRIRNALEKLDGPDFVRDLWTNAEELTLIAPANEESSWVMQLEGKTEENGKKKLLAMTIGDWEKMLIVREDGEERKVILPDPGDGSYDKVLPLVRSLFKLNFRGKYLPRDLKLSREFLR